MQGGQRLGRRLKEPLQDVPPVAAAGQPVFRGEKERRRKPQLAQDRQRHAQVVEIPIVERERDLTLSTRRSTRSTASGERRERYDLALARQLLELGAERGGGHRHVVAI